MRLQQRNPGKVGALVEMLNSSTLVAVTERRIITAKPKVLLRSGELDATYPLEDVRYARPRTNHEAQVRSTIGVTTERSDRQWMFPADVDHDCVDDLATVIEEGASARIEARAVNDRASVGLKPRTLEPQPDTSGE